MAFFRTSLLLLGVTLVVATLALPEKKGETPIPANGGHFLKPHALNKTLIKGHPRQQRFFGGGYLFNAGGGGGGGGGGAYGGGGGGGGGGSGGGGGGGGGGSGGGGGGGGGGVEYFW